MSAPSPTTSLTIPKSDDLEKLAEMKDLAFAEKRGCASPSQSRRHTIKCYQEYVSHHPKKLEHCRIAKDQDGTIMGVCQLQMPNDPGDLSLDSSLRHKLQNGEAYVEWIATHPDHTGKGIGSKLLKWAFEFCQRPEFAVTRLSLEVMAANEGAVRLYERKGFVVKHDPHMDVCDALLAPCFVFCCLGCQYCSILYMEKPILSTTEGGGTNGNREEMERG